MSLKTLPILYLNMGGEMVYILDQRLKAQSVKKEKSTKVLADIVGTMVNGKFMEELFKPQDLCSKKAMRTLFDKLAHASIMRLNQTSMDKLFDLMTMAVKYQLQACVSPRDLLLMTLNHLDGMRKLVQGAAAVQEQIDQVYQRLMSTYKTMSVWEWNFTRLCAVNFFQDTRVKVSILLREKKQASDGRFVVSRQNFIPYGSLIPGSFRYYNKGKPGRTHKFPSGGDYGEVGSEGSLEKIVSRQGDRGTELGTNMYKGDAAETQGGEGSSLGLKNQRESLAREELELLSHLISPKPTADRTDFTLSLFTNDDDEENFVEEAEASDSRSQKVLRIDASKRHRNSVDDLVEGMLPLGNRKERGEELLDLMDSTN